MADVATLGLQVESGSVQKGTDALNQLTGAAARAEAAANGLSGANRGATGAAAAAAKAYATEGAAAASASKQIEMMNRAANQNRASSRGNLGNIAAQFQDIAVSAQMGMGPLQIALQQGTQLAAVLSSMERPVLGLGAAFLSVLSPVSLLTIGIIALAAAGLQMVDWAKLAQSALMALADVLETVLPYAIAAAAALALIYAPSIVVGIVNVIAVLSRLVVAAGTVAASFTAAWLAAMGPIGWVIAGFSAVLAAAILFRDEMQQIFGRDLVADAKTGANFVIGSFVAAYHDIKFLWDQFPNVIGAAAIGAANAVIKAMTDMVQRGAGLIDSFASKANQWLPEGMQLGTIGDLGLDKDFQFANKYAEELAKAADKRNGKIASDLSADYLGDFGGAIARGASAASSKLKELAASLTEVDEKSKKRTGGKSEQEKYSDIVAGAERQIAALEAERDAIGLTEQAAAALRYETQLLNEAQQRGISLTDAQKSELSALAQVMASIEEETRQMGIALDFARELTGGFFDDFFSGIERGKSVWESFGDAAMGVLDRIADKLLNDVLDAVFQVSGAGGGVGGGGLLGWLFGGGSSVDPWAGLRGYANGTSSARPGVAWVGERGPELVRFKGGEEVIPNHRVMPAANNNGYAAQQIAPIAQREGRTVIEVKMSPDVEARIMENTTSNTVQLVQQNNAARENRYMNGEPQYG